MAKKDKAKQQAEDARAAVTEEVSKTVDDAQHAAGGLASGLKDAVAGARETVASGVGTVAETTTHAMSSVTHAVSSAIDKGAEALDVNEDGKVDAQDAAEVGRRCAPAKCVIS